MKKKQLVVVILISLLVSAFLGYGSTTMGGHESIIYPALEGLFLIGYGISLTILAANKKNRQYTITLLLTTFVAVLGGYLTFTLCF